ncbi:uncharacterized protein EDB91DRAFT_3332 [Suillus paluster]|uniref:uncharacterized protein n=1 Tax=Suillus paluster TaxID=48578 RepID=UPI001B884582|nr:uncharacterized protein EDB91DRAFT_3332 [Suillus paluster]KAG1756250.1 hypothetical protein EDB91DRAFT_3332 [Suillus paluster]
MAEMHHHTRSLRRLDLLNHYHFHCIASSTSVVCDTMPFPFALSRGLLLLAIGICNITSIVIVTLAFVAQTAGPFEVLAATSSSLAVFVFPITLLFLYCRRHGEATNTRNLVTFGALWLADFTSCIGLTVRAHQNKATGLCSDLSQSCNCTMAHALLALSYMSVIFAIIGFVIAYIDKHPGIATLSPRYPITKAPSSQFAALQYPLDVEMDNMYTPYPARNPKHPKRAHIEERWTDIPL